MGGESHPHGSVCLEIRLGESVEIATMVTRMARAACVAVGLPARLRETIYDRADALRPDPG
jgi:hypothetical protein